MNPEIIFKILRANGKDLLAIEEKVGGLGGLLRLEPHFYALYSHYAAGGIAQVFAQCGNEVQFLIEAIGPPNIAAILPSLGNIYKTATAT